MDELLKSNKNVKGLIEDDRFKSMFEDKDFARDKNSAEYKAVKPTAAAADSSDEEDLPVRKGLNSLFAGGDSTAQESKQVFEDKVRSGKKQNENRRLTSGAHHLVRPKEMD